MRVKNAAKLHFFSQKRHYKSYKNLAFFQKFIANHSKKHCKLYKACKESSKIPDFIAVFLVFHKYVIYIRVLRDGIKTGAGLVDVGQVTVT